MSKINETLHSNLYIGDKVFGLYMDHDKVELNFYGTRYVLWRHKAEAYFDVPPLAQVQTEQETARQVFCYKLANAINSKLNDKPLLHTGEYLTRSIVTKGNLEVRIWIKVGIEWGFTYSSPYTEKLISQVFDWQGNIIESESIKQQPLPLLES